ncbi:hypothetical protein PR202_ga29257 [Eleusine coracana subsp. coracana]|uniref:Uncharacterized protein n=1 Tax=Eleusine coracana subsp. coracana TaxID=191504 RepID=A0AAV5DLN3_ELECO|nr:hypothetical protein PR202_ga29257 [Eleusine coracana subsp. coracana]
MGVQRRFLNLIVDNPGCGTKSLRCINLSRQKLFNRTAPAQQTNISGSESGGGPQEPTIRAPEVAVNQKKKQAALKFGRISLPDPSFSFRAAASDLNDQRMHSFPLGDSRVFCADQSGRSFVLEAGSRRLVTMPRLHTPKSMPITLFIPGSDLEDHEAGRGSFFVMERIPKPEASCSAEESDQFQAFEYRRVSWQPRKCWASRLLPPPPYLRDITCVRQSCPEISSYAVVGSEICSPPPRPLLTFWIEYLLPVTQPQKQLRPGVSSVVNRLTSRVLCLKHSFEIALIPRRRVSVGFGAPSLSSFSVGASPRVGAPSRSSSSCRSDSSSR